MYLEKIIILLLDHSIVFFLQFCFLSPFLQIVKFIIPNYITPAKNDCNYLLNQYGSLRCISREIGNQNLIPFFISILWYRLTEYSEGIDWGSRGD